MVLFHHPIDKRCAPFVHLGTFYSAIDNHCRYMCALYLFVVNCESEWHRVRSAATGGVFKVKPVLSGTTADVSADRLVSSFRDNL